MSRVDGKIRVTNRLRKGDQRNVMDVEATSAGTTTHSFTLETDTVLLSLFAESVSGTLDVVARAEDGKGNTVDIITFPQLTGPTTDILIRKAGLALANVVLEATYSDSADFHVVAKAIDGADTTVSISGAAATQFTKKDVTTTPAALLSASLADRDGIVIKNYTGGGVVFIGDSVGTATDAGGGYPLITGEALAIDLAAGEAIFASSSAGTVDVRVIESGA